MIHLDGAEADGTHRTALPRTGQRVAVAGRHRRHVGTAMLAVLAADEDQAVALRAADRREARVTERAFRGVRRNGRAAIGTIERASVHQSVERLRGALGVLAA